MTDAQPHSDVYARLAVSPIHGIGVFAIRDIPRGTNVFANDTRPINWVKAEDINISALSAAQRQLYADFGVRRGGMLGCPRNFNLLSVGWYVNEPVAGERANLQATQALDMIAVRDITAGEELTISYALFSEPHVKGLD